MNEEDDQLYIYKLYGISTPRRLKAQRELRRKIGSGVKINDIQIARAQEIIDKPRFDYKPYAMESISQIEGLIKEAGDITYMREDVVSAMLVPLIQIKGQAAMFGNKLASQLSARILSLIEYYKRLDKDILDILYIYCKSIRVSYDHKLYESDTQKGAELLSEIDYAIDRYNKKFKAMTGR
jgi:hypothetical protein